MVCQYKTTSIFVLKLYEHSVLAPRHTDTKARKRDMGGKRDRSGWVFYVNVCFSAHQWNISKSKFASPFSGTSRESRFYVCLRFFGLTVLWSWSMSAFPGVVIFEIQMEKHEIELLGNMELGASQIWARTDFHGCHVWPMLRVTIQV